MVHWTDGQTDTPSYRDGWTHVKNLFSVTKSYLRLWNRSRFKKLIENVKFNNPLLKWLEMIGRFIILNVRIKTKVGGASDGILQDTEQTVKSTRACRG